MSSFLLSCVFSTMLVGSTAVGGVSRLSLWKKKQAQDLEWYILAPPIPHLYSSSSAPWSHHSHSLDLYSLCQAVGVEPESVALHHAPSPSPSSPLNQSYNELAGLVNFPPLYTLGFPPGVRPYLPSVAASFGFLVHPVPPAQVHSLHYLPEVLSSPSLSLSPLPGWVVGVNTHNNPITLCLPPGSSLRLKGKSARRWLESVGMTYRSVSTISSFHPSSSLYGGIRILDPDSPEISTLGVPTRHTELFPKVLSDLWAHAWHPLSCRIFLDPADTHPSIKTDLILDTEGCIYSGKEEHHFTPLV